MPLARRILKAILGIYLHLYHRLEVEGMENVPARGPAIVVVNHASLLDVPVLMVADPFPDTATIVKASMFNSSFFSWFLRQWGAIPVERQGRDSTGVRRMLGVLREGRVMAVAAEGIRGSFEALPPGAKLPRPKKIVVRVGKPFRFDRGTDAATAAQRIQDEIAALLPPHMQPQ
jgi:1-acyl-sn-glycerol-3-phosphate acyltransferase